MRWSTATGALGVSFLNRTLAHPDSLPCTCHLKRSRHDGGCSSLDGFAGSPASPRLGPPFGPGAAEETWAAGLIGFTGWDGRFAPGRSALRLRHLVDRGRLGGPGVPRAWAGYCPAGHWLDFDGAAGGRKTGRAAQALAAGASPAESPWRGAGMERILPCWKQCPQQREAAGVGPLVWICNRSDASISGASPNRG